MADANELQKARADIDRIDGQILDALKERMEVSRRVAEYKIEHGMPVLDEQRERAVIESRTERAREAGLPVGIEDLYTVILRMSRTRQEELIAEHAALEQGKRHMAAFQGVPGANSHLALVAFLGSGISTEHYDTFDEVFAAVESGEAAYGVVPVENSYAGSVMQVYDLLGKYAVYVIGERSMPISHSLLAIPGTRIEDLKAVYSHEQALAQSAPFFAAHPGLAPVPYYNTAGAAKFVAEQADRTVGALANPYAGKLYGLEILQEETSASPENTTRFLLISARPYPGNDANKAAVRFTLAHTPGSLAQALQHFASYGLNMVKIESRPVRDRNFEYAFYVDFEGQDVAPKTRRALAVDETIFADVRVLGTYRK